MKTFKEIEQKWLKDPEYKKAYDNSRFEFSLVCAIIDQRIKNGLTQKMLANQMGINQSAIARFESGQSNPTLMFLKKLTKVLGLKLVVQA